MGNYPAEGASRIVDMAAFGEELCLGRSLKEREKSMENIPGMLIAAPTSGSGKTVAVCGLLGAFKGKGYRPAAFKCGPDYIDPMFHREVLGVESGNLDGFFQDRLSMEENVKNVIREGGGEFALVEGVMGYFDGTGKGGWKASSWETAAWLDLPVVLVIDGRGSFLTAEAILQGFMQFNPCWPKPLPDELKRPGNGIQAVILNRVSKSTFLRLKPLIEERFNLPAAGYLPKMDWLSLESRHLGLMLPGEIKTLKEQLARLSETAAETIDLDLLLKIMGTSGLKRGKEKVENPSLPSTGEKRLCIGVAWDQAFSFYYRENLRMIEELGGRLVWFSPLEDERLPEEIDGLLLGGGYPEAYAEKLSKNRSMAWSVKERAEKGMPVLAECGGFLYLQQQLMDTGGKLYPMAGFLPGIGTGPHGLKRFGYITLSPFEDGLYLKAGEQVRGHEFHYWDSDCCGELMEAKKPESSRSWPCMIAKKRVMAGFPHLYYPSCPQIPRRFIEQCRIYHQEKEKKDGSSHDGRKGDFTG